MKRRIAYIVVFLGILAVIFIARGYHKNVAKNGGYLGEDIVFFNDNDDSTIVEETPAQKEESAKKSPSPTENETAKLSNQTAKPSATAVETPKAYDKIISQDKVKAYDTGTVVIGNAAYELYSYVDNTAKRYASIINRLAKKLGDNAQIYTMVAPTSTGITLPDNKRSKVNSSSQEKALQKIEKKLSGKENFVPLYDKLMQHRKEYIYFRTDHHWTSLGAYYAYEAFCESKGITPNPLDAYEKKKVRGFRGTFYGETHENTALKEDKLISYIPLSKKITMKYTTTKGVTATAPLIADATDYSANLKYCAYIAGDNPYTVIKNKDIKEKSSCVVVKESYGNAFVPYLADHYQIIYVIDYRYWEGNLAKLIDEKKCDDVIFINNISMTRNSYLVGKLEQIIS